MRAGSLFTGSVLSHSGGLPTAPRAEEPPSHPPLRRGENHQKGTHPQGTPRTHRLKNMLRGSLHSSRRSPSIGAAWCSIPSAHPASRLTRLQLDDGTSGVVDPSCATTCSL